MPRPLFAQIYGRWGLRAGSSRQGTLPVAQPAPPHQENHIGGSEEPEFQVTSVPSEPSKAPIRGRGDTVKVEIQAEDAGHEGEAVKGQVGLRRGAGQNQPPSQCSWKPPERLPGLS